jgi:DNA helicase HerA-like ATPase
MFELQAQMKAQMGKLDNASAIARYMRLSNRIDEVLQDSRYNFMFSRALAADTMKDFLARILRLPANGKPISIIDLSGVPSDIVAVVVALLSRIVLDFAIWSREERPRPVLLVCEEAHRYLPAIALQGHSSVRVALERIAKEGRKYGVALGLVTQRPSDLAEGALSQCGTIIAMRLNNDRDQRRVRDAMPEGGRSFLDSIPALRRGECVIVGEGVAIPMRVGIDELQADKRPRSEDPSFSEHWSKPGGESEALDRTIHRWRSQTDSIAKPDPEPVSLFLRNPSVRDVA